jgi:mono/diheme cytochrome c family protein
MDFLANPGGIYYDNDQLVSFCLRLRIMGMRAFFSLVGVLLVSAGYGNGGEGPSPFGLKLLDTASQIHALGDTDGCRAVVAVFLSPECPISNQYIPELNRIYGARGEGVEFYGVVVDPALTREQVAKYAADFKLEFPLLFDPAGVLAAVCRPTHVPQAFVFDHQGALVYQGRIDDQFASVGRRRERASQHNLREAIEAAVAGRTPEVRQADAVGCRIEGFGATAEVTYARHIAPILYARCAGCHRPGEVAPFALLTYEDAAKRAEFLVDVTSSRLMPPWHARDEYARFRGDRRLSEREIQLIADWARGGVPRGADADMPAVPPFSEGWQLGEPDLVLAMNEAFHVKADGPDSFRFFVIPIDIPEDKVVAAVEFRPGNPRVVHHAILYLDRSGVAMKRDLADPEPGYEGFLTGGFRPAGSLGFWAPGYTPRFLPRGVGQRLARGTDLALQLHYHPSGREETDRSQVGIHFADKPVERYVSGFAMSDFRVDIPPGEPRHKMHYSFTTPVDIEIMDVTPHMHMIGREMKATATPPDGQSITLVWTDWNFNWQEQYLYREPVRLPAGTRIDLEAWYDNSADNPYNPNQPPARVRLGEMTTDEMCICAFRLISDPDENKRRELQRAVGKSMQEQLSDPAVMMQVMGLVSRGLPPGDRPNIRELIGTIGGRGDDAAKAAE